LNGYTEKEYIEAYFGKDMARRLQTENRHDPLYTEQKTWKEKYPLDSFLKTPGLLKKEAQLEKFGLGFNPDEAPNNLLPKDPDLAEYLRHKDQTDVDSIAPHPGAS